MAKKESFEIAFEQPLFQSERIAEDWARMRHEITSSTELEAAYRAIAPEVAALDLKLSESEAQELLDLYNAAVVDGRYVDDLISDPAGVARLLKIDVSNNGIKAIKKAGSIEVLQGTEGVAEAASAAVAIVVVAIVIVIVFGPKRPKMVIDSSGIIKL